MLRVADLEAIRGEVEAGQTSLSELKREVEVDNFYGCFLRLVERGELKIVPVGDRVNVYGVGGANGSRSDR